MSAFKGEVPVTRKEIRAAVRSIMGETFDFLEKDNDIAAVKDTIETSTMIRPWDGARSQQIAASNYSEGVNITNNMTTMNETHYHYEGNRLSTVPGSKSFISHLALPLDLLLTFEKCSPRNSKTP
jgi:hypothetical protein